MRITRHYIDIGNRRVHYRLAGDGPPLLMIHQSPRSSAEYEPLMEKWASHFTCIAPDTPGFGLSAPLAGSPDIDAFADGLIALVEALGLEKVAAYGFHSGGVILVAALKRRPDLFSALAIGGYAVWTQEELRVFSESYLPPLLPSAYGEHLTWLWNRMLEQTWFFPWFDVRPEARIEMAHDDPSVTDAAVREMLDSGDAYRSGYGAVIRAPRELPEAGFRSPPVLITAYDGDPLQSHLARLTRLPESWSARPVATPREHHDASLTFLSEHAAPQAEMFPEASDEGFVRVSTEHFDGRIHWRGDRSANRVVLHAPGRSAELLSDADALFLDLPGHGLSDDIECGEDIEPWARVVAASIAALSTGSALTIVGEGASGLLALAVARHVAAVRVEAIRAHIPLESATREWLAYHPDLIPDRFGSHLARAWSVVRASQFFWPWFRADAAHAIPFDVEETVPERLSLQHRSFIRARSAKALLAALLTADRAALLRDSPPLGDWRIDDWARSNPEIWTPVLPG